MVEEYTKAKYDRFEDATRVATTMIGVKPAGDSNGRLLIAFRCDLPGERSAPYLRGVEYRRADDIMAFLAAELGTRYGRIYLLANFIGGDRFSRGDKLYLIIDGDHRMRLDAKQATSNPTGIGREPTQTLVYEITEADLRDLLGARSVEGRLGSLEFEIPVEGLAKLSAIGRDLIG